MIVHDLRCESNNIDRSSMDLCKIMLIAGRLRIFLI